MYIYVYIYIYTYIYMLEIQSKTTIKKTEISAYNDFLKKCTSLL